MQKHWEYISNVEWWVPLFKYEKIKTFSATQPPLTDRSRTQVKGEFSFFFHWFEWRGFEKNTSRKKFEKTKLQLNGQVKNKDSVRSSKPKKNYSQTWTNEKKKELTCGSQIILNDTTKCLPKAGRFKHDTEIMEASKRAFNNNGVERHLDIGCHTHSARNWNFHKQTSILENK